MIDKFKEGVVTLPERDIWIAKLPATDGNRSKKFSSAAAILF